MRCVFSVLCAVSGVQSQTFTVDRQMQRYSVTRSTFTTKWIGTLLVSIDLRSSPEPACRPGANPWRVINQIQTKLHIPAAAVQVPIGVEDQLKGVVDFVRCEGRPSTTVPKGEPTVDIVESDEIPASALEIATQKRTELIEQLAEVDDEIADQRRSRRASSRCSKGHTIREPDLRRAHGPARRRVPRGRLAGARLPPRRYRRVPRGAPQDEARHPRADRDGRSRRAHRVPERGDRLAYCAAWDDHR
ncbi:hypothetical protein EDB86DRAFT_3048599 [Lactarius hatsudake]|nr:hypothetical protein EDB86DRAFT_3048599 [Lactarius hatsudake]